MYDGNMKTTIMPTRFLREDDLTQASVLTVVWDKNAVRYFKLMDGSWASNDLAIFTTAQLLKKRVRHCPI